MNTVLLKGTNVPQTFGPFGGYDWGNINKYGGYQYLTHLPPYIYGSKNYFTVWRVTGGK